MRGSRKCARCSRTRCSRKEEASVAATARGVANAGSTRKSRSPSTRKVERDAARSRPAREPSPIANRQPKSCIACDAAIAEQHSENRSTELACLGAHARVDHRVPIGIVARRGLKLAAPIAQAGKALPHRREPRTELVRLDAPMCLRRGEDDTDPADGEGDERERAKRNDDGKRVAHAREPVPEEGEARLAHGECERRSDHDVGKLVIFIAG